MILAALMTAAAATTVAHSTEAIDLARQVASQGLLATIAPMQARSEVEEMVRDHPELTPAEQARLRAIGDERAKALVERAVDAEANAIAANISLEDLRALAGFAGSPAAEHQRAAMPSIMAATLGALGDVDFSGSVRTAFCSETHKLCDD